MTVEREPNPHPSGLNSTLVAVKGSQLADIYVAEESTAP